MNRFTHVSLFPKLTQSFRKTALALPAILGFTACEKIEERMPIKEERSISEHSSVPKFPVSSAKRFYDEETPAAGAAPQGNPLVWTTPEGWTEVPPSSSPGSMRLIDLRFGPNQEGECYLSAIQGNAGGLDANVNRWRTQMAQAPFTPEELAKLETKTFLGRPTPFVAFDGDYSNVGVAAPLKGYRLLGLVQVAPEFTIFVKMTGPKELVEKNAAAFEQFAQSVNIKR